MTLVSENGIKKRKGSETMDYWKKANRGWKMKVGRLYKQKKITKVAYESLLKYAKDSSITQKVRL